MGGRYPLLRVDEPYTRSPKVIAERIINEMARGELVHPNGFKVSCTYREQLITRSIGWITNYVLGTVQTSMPHWVVLTMDSGPWVDNEQENKYYDESRAIEAKAEEREEEEFTFVSQLLGEFPKAEVWAVTFRVRPVGLKDIIDGYPFRTEAP